jgi:hypothetical protein
VIEIMLSADGGCVFCESELIKLFVSQFPKYKDLAGELFKSKFESDIELPEEIKQEEIKLYGRDDGKIYFLGWGKGNMRFRRRETVQLFC